MIAFGHFWVVDHASMGVYLVQFPMSWDTLHLSETPLISDRAIWRQVAGFWSASRLSIYVDSTWIDRYLSWLYRIFRARDVGMRDTTHLLSRSSYHGMLNWRLERFLLTLGSSSHLVSKTFMAMLAIATKISASSKQRRLTLKYKLIMFPYSSEELDWSALKLSPTRNLRTQGIFRISIDHATLLQKSIPYVVLSSREQTIQTEAAQIST